MKTILTKDQIKDSGLVAVLICLLLSGVVASTWLLILAMALLCIAIAFPAVFRPFAIVWFGFAQFISSIVSVLLLTVLFFLLVVPVGMVRRLLGRDALGLKKFGNKSAKSFFETRGHTFTREDVKNPW